MALGIEIMLATLESRLLKMSCAAGDGKSFSIYTTIFENQNRKNPYSGIESKLVNRILMPIKGLNI